MSTHDIIVAVDDSKKVELALTDTGRKGVNEALHVAKREIDDMHYRERRLLGLDQQDIRTIEDIVRERIADCDGLKIDVNETILDAIEFGLARADNKDSYRLTTNMAYVEGEVDRARNHC